MTTADLDNIRHLYRTNQIEPQHVAALLNELDRLETNHRRELQVVLSQVADLSGKVARLTVARQDDARRYVQDLYLKNSPGFLDSLEDAIGLGRSEDDALTRLARIIEGAASLRAMVPRPPVVGWFPTTVGEAARAGMFWMGVGPGGWTLRARLPNSFGTGDFVATGPETGPEGKAKAVAAWQRACGGAQ